MMNKGFVTLATGGEQFYRIAWNLLQSYRHFTSEPLPFAIVCDRKNSFTEAFDDVIVLENATCSYMDKLSLLKLVPYDETIFIDADCLAYGDLNGIFDLFKEADDLSCFGNAVPLDSDKGFFKAENVGHYANEITFCTGLHGGIVFYRKSDILSRIYDTCCEIRDHYHEYKFKYFKKPADEPIIALAMSVHGIRPLPVDSSPLVYYPACTNDLRFDILNAKISFKSGASSHNLLIVHFGSTVTKEQIYLIEERNLELLCGGKSLKTSLRAFLKPYRISLFIGNVRRKMNVHIYNLKCTLKPIFMKLFRRK